MMNTLLRKQFNLDNFYNFLMNEQKYKDANVLEIFGDIKKILCYFDEEKDTEYTDELKNLLMNLKASETIKIIVDFLRNIDPITEYLYLPTSNEIEDFVVKAYEETIDLGREMNSKSSEFRDIVALSDVFTMVDWLRGPKAYYWIISGQPLDFINILTLCHFLTKKEINDPSIAVLYEIAW